MAFDRCQLFMRKHGGTREEQEGALFIQEIGLNALLFKSPGKGGKQVLFPA